MIARVATEVSFRQLFDYRVPDELAPRLAVGQRWRVLLVPHALSLGGTCSRDTCGSRCFLSLQSVRLPAPPPRLPTILAIRG